jgi:hypothetical protein
MKWLTGLLVVFVMSTSARAEVNPNSGNWWVEPCKREGSAICTGFVAGMVQMNAMLTFVYHRPLWCLPNDVTIGQASKVIVRFLDDHPDQLHRPFVGLATDALITSFPCAPDTATVKAPR